MRPVEMRIVDLARKLGVSHGRVSNWERGENDPQQDLIPSIADALGIRIEWLITGEGEPRPAKKKDDSPLLSDPMALYSFGYRNIRYAGIVPCGNWGDPLDSDEMIPISAELEHPKRFAATVAGDSCYPALKQGDLTIWHADIAPPNGLIVLAQQKTEHGCTVKQLKMDDTGVPHLRPLNPNYGEPDNGDGWSVVARLVAVIRDDGHKKLYFIQSSGLRPEDLQ